MEEQPLHVTIQWFGKINGLDKEGYMSLTFPKAPTISTPEDITELVGQCAEQVKVQQRATGVHVHIIGVTRLPI